MSNQDDDGFIGRWARRKAEIASTGGLQKKAPEPPAPVRGRMNTDPAPAPVADPEAPIDDVVLLHPDDVAEGQDVSVAETETQEELDIEELERIDIEAMDFDADFTKFMQPGVPERLRQRALRRLWGTNPILANVDGLNDYDEDFTDAALAVDVLKSAWKVGQGYLTDEEVEARDAERLGDVAEEAITEEGDAPAVAAVDSEEAEVEADDGADAEVSATAETSGSDMAVDTLDGPTVAEQDNDGNVEVSTALPGRAPVSSS